MSAPVASAAMTVPTSVISTAAKTDGSDSADTLFDAMFAAFESLSGGGELQGQGIPATDDPSSQPQSTEPVSNAPANAGSWLVQIDSSDATGDPPVTKLAAGGSSNGKIEASETSDAHRQDLTKTGSARTRTVLQNFSGVAPQQATPTLTDDKSRSPRSEGVGTSGKQGSSAGSVPRSDGGSSQIAASSQESIDALLDKLGQAELNAGQQQAVDVSQPALKLPALPAKEISLDQDSSDKQDEPEGSQAAPDGAPTQGAQFNPVVRPLPSLSDAGTHVDYSQSDDAGGKPSAVEMPSGQSSRQVQAGAELPRHVSPQDNLGPRALLDNSTSQADANAATVVGSQTAEGSSGSKSSSTRAASMIPGTDAASTAQTKGDDAFRPQVGAQPISFHRSDAGTFTPAVDTATHMAAANSDTPVRVAFSAAPNPIDQPAFDALALRIAARSSDGDRNFSIRLDPPELGRIEVSLSVNATGHAQAEITADKPQTLDLLQRDAPALERALKDAGLNLAGGFAFSLKGEGKPGGTWRDMQHGSRGRNLQIAATDPAIASASLSGTAALAARAYGFSSARLDIKV